MEDLEEINNDMMEDGWVPGEKELDLDLTERFKDEKGIVSVRAIIARIKEGEMTPAIFYIKSSRNGKYFKIEVNRAPSPSPYAMQVRPPGVGQSSASNYLRPHTIITNLSVKQNTDELSSPYTMRLRKKKPVNIQQAIEPNMLEHASPYVMKIEHKSMIANTKPTVENLEIIFCLASHQVNRFNTRLSYPCKRCNLTIDAGMDMFRCRLCDWNCCLNCSIKYKDPPPKGLFTVELKNGRVDPWGVKWNFSKKDWYVEKVDSKKQADEKGLKLGDIVFEIDNEKIDVNRSDFQQKLSKESACEITLLRNQDKSPYELSQKIQQYQAHDDRNYLDISWMKKFETKGGSAYDKKKFGEALFWFNQQRKYRPHLVHCHNIEITEKRLVDDTEFGLKRKEFLDFLSDKYERDIIQETTLWSDIKKMWIQLQNNGCINSDIEEIRNSPMPQGWRPSERQQDLDLSNAFLNGQGKCSVRGAIQQIKDGRKSPPLFYLQSSKQNLYFKIEVESAQTAELRKWLVRSGLEDYYDIVREQKYADLKLLKTMDDGATSEFLQDIECKEQDITKMKSFLKELQNPHRSPYETTCNEEVIKSFQQISMTMQSQYVGTTTTTTTTILSRPTTTTTTMSKPTPFKDSTVEAFFSKNNFTTGLPSQFKHKTMEDLRKLSKELLIKDVGEEDAVKLYHLLHPSNLSNESNGSVTIDYDDHLECDICCELYDSQGSKIPTNLTCGHTFCKGCLSKSIKNSSVECPTCREITVLSSNNIDELPTAWTLLKIIEKQKATEKQKRTSLEWTCQETKAFFTKHRFPKDIQEHFRTFTMSDLKRCTQEELQRITDPGAGFNIYKQLKKNT